MELDDCMDTLSTIVYNISFKFHEKSFSKHSKPKKTVRNRNGLILTVSLLKIIFINTNVCSN